MYLTPSNCNTGITFLRNNYLWWRIFVLFLTIIVVKIAIPYVIKTEGTDYFMQPFIPSGNYFLYLMIFFFIVKIVLLIYNYYNEHYK